MPIDPIPFNTVFLDLYAPLPVSEEKGGLQFRYLLNMIDHHTRWIEIVPLENMEALAMQIS